MERETIDSQLELAWQADRFRLRRIWQKIQRMPQDSAHRQRDTDRFLHALQESIQRRSLREAANPTLHYDPELPISAHRETLIQALQEHQVLVVCGETGSGKSTQLPKICLEAGLGRKAMIGHTQPRRLAARSIANRLADELETKVGEWVGFKIRFNDRTQPNTLVKLMTDGVLLSEIQRDHFLDAYDAIIIDEAHERSLNIDLLLAYLHELLRKRRDLKLIITSATIDAERFAEHFGTVDQPAPIFLIEGRTYPVEIRYRGADTVEVSEENDWLSRMCQAVDELSDEGGGDILTFLPSERDIRDAARHLRGHLTRSGMLERNEILPLYSRLTEAEQQKIFQPHRHRRIVLATNVAESSLTVPGIRYVIDLGTARISRYAPRSKVQRLPIEAVSQASADQRAGRCGRLGPGICIRLFSESDYAGRARFTTPEIRRTNLASAILQTRLLGVGDLEQMPLLDPPRPEMIRDGMATLREINALDSEDRLTEIGKRLGRWPVDPRIGRMLIEAEKNGCLADVLIIASGLEVQDPRMRPAEKQQAADQAHAKFLDPHSDFLSLLRVWDFYHRLKEELGRSRLEKACREHFLSLPRLREWADVHRQLMEMMAEHQGRSGSWKLPPRKHLVQQWEAPIATKDAQEPVKKIFPSGYDAIHLSLLAGLWSGVAMLEEEKKYKGAGGIDFSIWPGSGLKQSRPKWIVAAEIVETHQRYGRVVAAIDREWIEPRASHLLKSSYEQPHFSRKHGSAMVYRKATLFGLPVVARTQVPLAPIDPAMARKLLIEEGLAEQQLVSRAAFYRHNQQQLADLQEWAHRTRRRDFVADTYRLHQFYEQHLPQTVVDRTSLEKWDRSLKKDHPIFFRWEDLVADFDRQSATEAFPDYLHVGTMRLPLSYRFEPGGHQDGIHVQVPQVALAQLDQQSFEWLVPGLLEEKVLYLIRALPKNLRRNLVPAPDTAKVVASTLQLSPWKDRPFWEAVCEVLSKQAGESIKSTDFHVDKLPDHLRIQFEVIDDQGKVVEQDRDLESLQQKLASHQAVVVSESTSEVADESWQRSKMTQWDIEELPESIELKRRGIRVTVHPTLIIDGEGVRTEIVDRKEEADRLLKSALIRLFSLVERRELRSQVVHLPNFSQCQLRLASRIPSDRLQPALCDLMARIAFVDDKPLIRTRDDFELRRVGRVQAISMAAQDLAKWLPKLAEQYHLVALGLEKAPSLWKANLESIRSQLQELFREEFLLHTPWTWLKEYPRYLQAIVARLERLKTIGPSKDAAIDQEVQAFWKLYQTQQVPSTQSWPEGDAIETRWMIEEFRVSLFAQQLGTKIPVSAKRLEKKFEKK